MTNPADDKPEERSPAGLDQGAAERRLQDDLDRLGDAKESAGARETRDRERLAQSAADALPPEPGQDRGPWLSQGLTLEERRTIGLEEIEAVSLGPGHSSANVVRRKWTHPLDRYLEEGKLGGPPEGAYRLDVGMRLAEDFNTALSAARVTASYETRGSGGVEGWSLAQIEARNRLARIFRGEHNPDGSYAVRPVLNKLASRLVLHVCCLSLGTASFDAAMMREGGNPGWRKGTSMCRLIEALDDLLDHRRQCFGSSR